MVSCGGSVAALDHHHPLGRALATTAVPNNSPSRTTATTMETSRARAIRAIDARYRTGELSAAEAGHQMSRTLRSFLALATSTRAQYMHVEDIGSSDLAEAAPLFAAFNDAQFNTASQVEISRVGSTAEELIRSWA